MGQIGDGLHHLFPAVALYLVEKNCESNRCDKTERQIQHAHAKGVAQGTEEGDVAEQLYKFVETNELGAEQPVFGLIILETDDPAPQGQVVEYKTENKENQRPEDQNLLFLYLLPKGFFLPGSNNRHC